jgi:hypothetical protein
VSVAGVKQEGVAGAKEAVRKSKPWIEVAVRCGYVAKGILYGFIGILALLSAVGQGGKAANQKGAIDTLAQYHYSGPLLIAMAISLWAYSTWRLSLAIFNPEHKKPLSRIVYALASFVYFGLGYAAFQGAQGLQTHGTSPQHYAGAIEHPAGRYLAMLAGLVVIGVGVGEAVIAYTKKFMKVFKTEEMGPKQVAFATTFGQAGLAARAVVFFLTGWFLLRAGFDRNANEAGGISKALLTLATQPFGRWLLGLAAIGLIAYGLFMFVEARYRKIAAVDDNPGPSSG